MNLPFEYERLAIGEFGGATPTTPGWAGSMGGYHRWFYNPSNDTYNAVAPTVTGPGLFVFAPVR